MASTSPDTPMPRRNTRSASTGSIARIRIWSVPSAAAEIEQRPGRAAVHAAGHRRDQLAAVGQREVDRLGIAGRDLDARDQIAGVGGKDGRFERRAAVVRRDHTIGRARIAERHGDGHDVRPVVRDRRRRPGPMRRPASRRPRASCTRGRRSRSACCRQPRTGDATAPGPFDRGGHSCWRAARTSMSRSGPRCGSRPRRSWWRSGSRPSDRAAPGSSGRLGTRRPRARWRRKRARRGRR